MNHSATHAQFKMMVENRLPHEEYTRIKLTTLDQAVADFSRVVNAAIDKSPTVCQCCEQAPTFDLTAHLLVSSRDKPFAAAAAANMLKAVQS